MHSNTALTPSKPPAPRIPQDARAGGPPCADAACCMALLRGGADSLLSQCESLVRATDTRTLTGVSKVLPGGTIGKHVRHLLDHFNAILSASGAFAESIIDYEHRERDTLTEREPSAAVGAIAAARLALSLLPDHAEAKVLVRVMVAGQGTTTVIASTLARELAFATHHAVHHQAMIGAIAAEMGVAVHEGFGKAPSTLAHERARAGVGVSKG